MVDRIDHITKQIRPNEMPKYKCESMIDPRDILYMKKMNQRAKSINNYMNKTKMFNYVSRFQIKHHLYRQKILCKVTNL